MTGRYLRFRLVHDENEARRLCAELGGTYEAWDREDGCFIVWYK